MGPGTHRISKWLYSLSIPGLLALIIPLSTCHSSAVLASYSPNDVIAIAFPAKVSPEELGNVLKRHGIDTILNESTVLVPMTDFVRLQHLSVSEFSRRVQAGDPRSTPLSSSLVSSFSAAGVDGPWHIWYVPIATATVYKAIQTAFLEIGSEWAWDARLPSPVLDFLWIVWLSWILWLLITRQVKERLYHGVLIMAWLPVAFFQTLPAAALMVVGQSISAILGMEALANGKKHSLTRNHTPRLLINLLPFILSMLILVTIDMSLLIPATISLVLTIIALVYRNSILVFLTKGRMHFYPPFRLILEEPLRIKAAGLGIWSLIPLAMLALILLLVPYRADGKNTYRVAFKTDADQSILDSDYSDMIRSHTRYQEALALGRLGDASWMSDSYSKPYHFEVQENRIVRGSLDRLTTAESFESSQELEKGMRLVLKHTGGQVPRVVTDDDIPGNMGLQLDTQGAVFYIMAMAPFCVLGLHRVSQSRRRMRSSYTNRQVA